MFWLDAAEPEISTGAAQAAADGYNSSIGTGQATGMMFPDCESQDFQNLRGGLSAVRGHRSRADGL